MGVVETAEEGRVEWLEMPRGIPEKHQQFGARERPQQERWTKPKETGRREPGGPCQRVKMRLCTLLVLTHQVLLVRLCTYLTLPTLTLVR